MIWLISIPFIIYFTFKNLYLSGFPSINPENTRNFLEWVFLIFAGSFFSFLISLVPIGMAYFIQSTYEVTGVKDREYPLVALREKDGISGNFYFLGSGTFQDSQYYFWYRKDGDHISGGKTLREQGVRIYEEPGEAKMMTYKTAYKSEWTKKYGWIFGLGIEEDHKWCDTFSIPLGSIKEGYSL